jgi:hypothetical protein
MRFCSCWSSSFYLVAVRIFAENSNVEAQKWFSRTPTSSKNTTIWPVHSTDSLWTLLLIGLYWFTGLSGPQTAIFCTIFKPKCNWLSKNYLEITCYGAIRTTNIKPLHQYWCYMGTRSKKRPILSPFVLFLQAIYSEMTQNSAILAVFPGF